MKEDTATGFNEMTHPEIISTGKGGKMIYLIYVLMAAGVVWFSSKAAVYVDMLEARTRLSGAFLGGVMLSAVTSLPELFTSLSTTILLNKPGMCLGNILGSDLFNSAVLAVLMLLFFRRFSRASISRSQSVTALFVILMYAVTMLNYLHVLSFQILSISVTSVLILILYLLGVRFMAMDNAEMAPVLPEEEERSEHDITMKQLITRLVLFCIGIVVVSIIITKVTDLIAIRLHLGDGLAGAILLGIATSLPELASTTKLFRIDSYNIAIGNIVGSNLFNFIILFAADLFYFGRGLYDFSDHSTVNLLWCGGLSAITMFLIMKWKNRLTQILCPIVIIGCYAAFLLI